MKWAILVVLVVALVALVLYAARTEAEAMPMEPPPLRYSAMGPVQQVPTITLERTAEETWRANVMRTAQDYERAISTYVDRFPSYQPGRRALGFARAIAAAAPMESRASLTFRIGFAVGPPAGAGAARRAWDALVAAVRAPIDFRPTLPVVPVVVTGVTSLEMPEGPA